VLRYLVDHMNGALACADPASVDAMPRVAVRDVPPGGRISGAQRSYTPPYAIDFITGFGYA
jgi:hypothetical protein